MKNIFDLSNLFRFADKSEKEYIDGGKARGHNADEYDQEQLEKGVKVEQEHVEGAESLSVWWYNQQRMAKHSK